MTVFAGESVFRWELLLYDLSLSDRDSRWGYNFDFLLQKYNTMHHPVISDASQDLETELNRAYTNTVGRKPSSIESTVAYLLLFSVLTKRASGSHSRDVCLSALYKSVAKKLSNNFEAPLIRSVLFSD